jgi:hypothetical protein
MKPLVVYAADVGSIRLRRFGWARVAAGDCDAVLRTGTGIEEIAPLVTEDLAAGYRVALGFECPLFIPLRDAPEELTAQRNGDKGNAWSGRAGSLALTQGVAQIPFVLRSIHRAARERQVRLSTTILPEDLVSGRADLLLFEAFVAGDGKVRSDAGASNTHVADAEAAARLCACRLLSGPCDSDVCEAGPVFSLLGAMVLRAGLSDDARLLETPCWVVKVTGPVEGEP